MGKIARFKQGALASEAVGTVGVDQSAGAIADAVGQISNTLIEREKALNDVKAQNQFFDYSQQDDLLQTKLQKQFSLNPEGYRKEYTKQSQSLINTFDKTIPDSSRTKYNQLVNRKSTTTSKNNLSWVFSQQNKVALDGVNEMGVKFGAAASTKVTADDFMALVGEFSIAFDGSAGKVLDGLSAKTSKREFMTTGFDGFRRGMLEPANGGAIQYQNDLRDNKKFQAMITGAFGEEGLQKLQKDAATAVRALIGKKAHQALINMDGNSRRIFAKQYASEEGISLIETGDNLRFAENALNETQTQAQSQGLDLSLQISYLQENVRQAQSVDNIARSANNHAVVSDPTSVSELNALIKLELQGITGTAGLRGLASETAKKLKGTLNRGGRKTIAAPSSNVVTAKLLGIKKSFSEYLVGLTLIEGKILRAREQGKIDDSDANAMLNQFMPQLKLLDRFDRVKKGTDAFSNMYEVFDDFANEIIIPGASGGTIAQQRDRVRNSMVDAFISRSFSITQGMDLINVTDDLKQGALFKLAEDIKNERLQSFLPADVRGAPKGAFTVFSGRTVETVGINQTTGQFVIRVPKDFNKEVGNT